MDTLVSVGATVAFGYSAAATLAPPLRGQPTYFDVAALIVTLISIGKYLEVVARGRRVRPSSSSRPFQPRVAHRLEEGDPARVTDVGPAAGGRLLLLVRPGEPIPADGRCSTAGARWTRRCSPGRASPSPKPRGTS